MPLSRFVPLQTRADDVFAAELRQTCLLLLTYAANPQISALLQGADEVFANQAFPPVGTLAAPGWANMRDLLSPDADAPQAAEYALPLTTSDLKTIPADAATVPGPIRWFLSA